MGWPRTAQNLPNQTQISSLNISLNILTITVLSVLSENFSTVNMANWALTVSNLWQKSFRKEAVLKLT